MKTQMTRCRLLASSTLLLCISGSAVQAATTTTTFNVSATISAACNVTATDLAFGAYNPASGTALDGSSTLSVACTSGTTYTLALDVGSAGGSFTGRTMASGANTLAYNLFTSAARTTVWGDGSGSTTTVSGTGSGVLTNNSHTVYGRIGIGQDKPVGSYGSTITVSLNF